DQALKGLPFSPGLFAPFAAAVESARTKTPLETPALQNTAFGARMASLMFEHGGGWTAIVPLRKVADRKQLAEIVAGWNIPAVTYVDLKTESNRLMSAYRDRTFVIVVCGLLVISVVLAVGMKSLSEFGSILSPIMSALVVVAAVVNL